MQRLHPYACETELPSETCAVSVKRKLGLLAKVTFSIRTHGMFNFVLPSRDKSQRLFIKLGDAVDNRVQLAGGQRDVEMTKTHRTLPAWRVPAHHCSRRQSKVHDRFRSPCCHFDRSGRLNSVPKIIAFPRQGHFKRIKIVTWFRSIFARPSGPHLLTGYSNFVNDKYSPLPWSRKEKVAWTALI